MPDKRTADGRQRDMRQLLSVFVMAAGLGFLLTSALGSSPAMAYPTSGYSEQNCHEVHYYYRFTSGVPSNPVAAGGVAIGWDSTAESNTAIGFSTWDVIRYTSGSYIVDSSESSGGWDTYLVDFIHDPEKGWGGGAECFDPTYEDEFVMLDYLKSNGQMLYTTSMQGISAHEAGHVHGLDHSGGWDNIFYPGNKYEAPTMSKCHDPQDPDSPFRHVWPNQLRDLEADDYAALISHFDSNSMNPNPGFEHGSNPGWRRVGGSWTAPWNPSAAADGNRYLTLSGTNAYVYNDVRIFDTTYPGGTNDYRFSAKLKKASSFYYGSIQISLRRSTQTYGSDPVRAAQCGYPDPWDLNDAQPIAPAPSSWVTMKNLTFTPTTSWTNKWTAEYTNPGFSENMRVQVLNLTDGTIHIDTAQLKGDQ